MTSAQATKVIRKSRRAPSALIWLVLVSLTGCFGPPTMKYDIDAYNRDAVLAEQEMLLFNIGRLSQKQPPHFMILGTISQSRAFSTGMSLQWTHLWNSLFHLPGSTPSRSVTTRASDTYQVGPLAASSSENPTITFVPIQGQDFGARFESSLLTKFTYFLEDERLSEPYEARIWLAMLFTQSLDLTHGDSRCPKGLYYNRRRGPDEKDPEPGAPKHYYFDKFSECVEHILDRRLNYVEIDANHRIPTNTGAVPLAADVVTALTNGYKWINLRSSATTRQSVTADKDTTATEKTAKKTGKKTHTHETTKTDTVTGTEFALVNQVKIPALLDYDPFSVPAPRSAQDQMSYGDELVSQIWPVAYDYFYVEVRKKTELRERAPDDSTAKRLCATPGSSDDQGNGPICGFFKVGNLLQIMQRLGDMCSDIRSAQEKDACIFGIGSSAPTWADSSAEYVSRPERVIDEKKSIWVPGHDPKDEQHLARRDRYIFMTLYKLYQMSVVDTSKLVTTAPAITISK